MSPGILGNVDYQRRIIDQSLDELMPGLSAIALDGAKGVGKTATGLQRANTVFDLSGLFTIGRVVGV